MTLHLLRLFSGSQKHYLIQHTSAKLPNYLLSRPIHLALCPSILRLPNWWRSLSLLITSSVSTWFFVDAWYLFCLQQFFFLHKQMVVNDTNREDVYIFCTFLQWWGSTCSCSTTIPAVMNAIWYSLPWMRLISFKTFFGCPPSDRRLAPAPSPCVRCGLSCILLGNTAAMR